MIRRVYHTNPRLSVQNFIKLYKRSYVHDMAEKNISTIEFDALKEKVLKHGLTLIDVREASELIKDGKIPRSINIPLGDIGEAFKLSDADFHTKYGVSKPDYTSHFVLSCKSGKRATKAFDSLKTFNYKNMSVYSGSFLDWVEKGGPVEK